MNRKKLLQIILFSLIVLFLGWLLWWMFWRSEPVEYVNVNGELIPRGQLPNINEGPVGVINTNVNGSLPGAGNQNINVNTNVNAPVNVNATPGQQVTDKAVGGLTQVHTVVGKPVKDPVFTSDGQGFNFYSELDNKFYRMTEDGQVDTLSEKEFYNVETASWSSDGNKAILEYPDGSNILYDFTAEKQYTLPQPMTEFDFTQNDDRIAFKWLSDYEGDNWLGVASPDGSEINFIEPMSDQESNVQVSWSKNSQVVALYSQGAGFDTSNVYLIGQYGENFKLLPVRGRGFASEWLPDGEHLMYSVYNESTGSRPSLWITRADGENIGQGNQPLNLQTWVDKCTFTASSAYCAVPESLPEGAGYVPEVANSIPDLFYKIDLETGVKTLLARPVGDQSSYTATQLMVTPNEDKLYFVDQQSGNLYNLNLQ